MKPIEEIKPGLFVQQTKTGWRVVKPIQKDPSKPFSFKNNINWKHFLIGDWGRLITFVVIILIVLFVVWAYRHDMNACAEKYAGECMAAKTNPCYSLCWTKCNYAQNDLIKPYFNISNGTG